MVCGICLTHCCGSFEPLLRGFLQLSSTESSKLLVEELESLLADAVSALSGHDNVEEDAWQELDPDGEVVHASAAPAQPRPHVQPVLQADAGNRDLAMVWGQSLLSTVPIFRRPCLASALPPRSCSP